MTKALDAAIRAAQEAGWRASDAYLHPGDIGQAGGEAALRAALPAEPPAALIEAMAQGMKRFDDWYSTSANAADGRDWYREKKARWVYDALRAYLLGDEA